MEISRIDLNKPERVSNTIIIDLFTKNYQRLNTEFFEFQFDWLNRAYAAFKDFDKYMILAFLFRKTFFSYSELFKVITFEQFFSNRALEVEKFNIIESKICDFKEMMLMTIVLLVVMGVCVSFKKNCS